jgi:UDP-N-acetylglucosamine 2-epimerase (non-hydrolysing)
MFPYPKYTTKTGFVKMTVLLVAGARPNFMKIAPLYRACPASIDLKIVHTGQHYDDNMSGVFFLDLGIPAPDYNLDCGSGSHAEQTAKIMVEFEKVCLIEKPDLVMVVGDVNSTVACSLVAKKLFIKVAHVEAGLRSWDMTMPEEINRIVTDSISDYFFVTERDGVKNLMQEGHPTQDIHLVGDVMVDNLLYQNALLGENKTSEYIFVTLHRPSNVDNPETFQEIIFAINDLADEIRVFFPMHPRTKKMSEKYGVIFNGNITVSSPLGYKESLYLWRDAKCVLTDSGGLQVETSALGTPCVTIRDTTERPETISLGTNVLAGTTREGILKAYDIALMKSGQTLPLADGKTAERIWRILVK